MPEFVTLTEDGPLGAAGTRVWVDDAAELTQSSKPASKPKTAGAKRGPKTTAEPVDKA